MKNTLEHYRSLLIAPEIGRKVPYVGKYENGAPSPNMLIENLSLDVCCIDSSNVPGEYRLIKVNDPACPVPTARLHVFIAVYGKDYSVSLLAQNCPPNAPYGCVDVFVIGIYYTLFAKGAGAIYGITHHMLKKWSEANAKRYDIRHLWDDYLTDYANKP